MSVSREMSEAETMERILMGSIEQKTQCGQSNEDNQESVMVLARNWLAIALRRRSTDLLVKSFSLAAQARIPLDELLIGRPGEDASPVMGFVKDLLFSPAIEQQLMDKPYTVDMIPTALLIPMIFPNGSTPESSIVLSTCRTHEGLLSIYASPSFELEILDRASIEHGYRTNSTSIIGSMFPVDEREKISRIIGVLFKTFNSPDSPPVVSVRSKVTRRDGNIVDAIVVLSLLHVMTAPERYSTYNVYRIEFDERATSPALMRGRSASISDDTPQHDSTAQKKNSPEHEHGLEFTSMPMGGGMAVDAYRTTQTQPVAVDAYRTASFKTTPPSLVPPSLRPIFHEQQQQQQHMAQVAPMGVYGHPEYPRPADATPAGMLHRVPYQRPEVAPPGVLYRMPYHAYPMMQSHTMMPMLYPAHTMGPSSWGVTACAPNWKDSAVGYESAESMDCESNGARHGDTARSLAALSTAAYFSETNPYGRPAAKRSRNDCGPSL